MKDQVSIRNVVENLKILINTGEERINEIGDSKISFKPSEDRWSKKEILGHLIDSAINNLRRFTEIQFNSKPYVIVPYDQDALVKVNDYQNSDLSEILNLWKYLNMRIAFVISAQSEETLLAEVVFSDGGLSDLRFLMLDYVAHMSHHLDQIDSASYK